MIISRCCKEAVHVLVDYYVCNKCGRSAQVQCSLSLSMEAAQDLSYDQESEAQV